MGRFFLYPLMALLAAFVLFAWLVVDRGSGSSGGVTEASLHTLLAFPQAYAGERVRVEGVLEELPGPGERFVIVSEALKIAVRGYSLPVLQRLRGQEVSVVGRLRLEGKRGPYIEAEEITPLR